MNTTTATTTVKAGAFRDAVRAVILAASTDPVLPILNAVEIGAADGRITLAATDRYRMHVADLPHDGPGFDPVLIPAKDLAHAVKGWKIPARGFVPDVTLDVTPSFDGDGGALALSFSGVRFDLSGAVGSFPAWHKLIPSDEREGGNFAAFRPEYLADAAKACGYAIDGRDPLRVLFGTPSQPAILTAGGDVLRVRALVMPVRIPSGGAA